MGSTLDNESPDFNTIGGSTAAARNISDGGVVIDPSGRQYNVVEGNRLYRHRRHRHVDACVCGKPVFVDLAGLVDSGDFDVIGGDAPGEGNLISGFQYGVEIQASDNQVQGNLIGTDVTGTHALGNADWGVTVGGSNNTIGGSAPGAGNLISGNHQGIDASGSGTVVEGNLVGTDITGTLALGNAGDGVNAWVETGLSLGGTTPGSGNVISANGLGIDIIGGGGVSVQGNMIGTDSSGTLPLGNGSGGIEVESQNNQIGGSMAGAGNVIAANGGNGVSIVVPVGSDNGPGSVLQGNDIGTNPSGAKDLGNAGDGVYIMGSTFVASDQTIGGTDPGAGNVIAYNGGAGVSSDSGPGDSIRGNDIFKNGGLGIVVGITWSSLDLRREAAGRGLA